MNNYDRYLIASGKLEPRNLTSFELGLRRASNTVIKLGAIGLVSGVLTSSPGLALSSLAVGTVGQGVSSKIARVSASRPLSS